MPGQQCTVKGTFVNKLTFQIGVLHISIRINAYLYKCKMQHLYQNKIASRTLCWSLKGNRTLSAIDKGNKNKIAKDENSPIKHFLERKKPMLVTICQEINSLHVSEYKSRAFIFKSSQPCDNRWPKHRRLD